MEKRKEQEKSFLPHFHVDPCTAQKFLFFFLSLRYIYLSIYVYICFTQPLSFQIPIPMEKIYVFISLIVIVLEEGEVRFLSVQPPLACLIPK